MTLISIYGYNLFVYGLVISFITFLLSLVSIKLITATTTTNFESEQSDLGEG